MMKFNLIVAVCENFGIGLKGDLPWKLRSELKYFSSTTKRVQDASKRNAVIMGRKTYFGVPASKRPLPERLNVVLSKTLQQSDLPADVLLYPDLASALECLQSDNVGKDIETIWIVGGSGVYKEAMASSKCHRLYITKIKADFECDTFFPGIPEDFKEVEPDVETPKGVQEENGIQYEYKILEKQVTC